MKQVPIRLGPLALLLTVVTICMTVMGILTFSTARADLAMAEKLAASTRERYALEAEGQAFLSAIQEEAVPVGGVFICGGDNPRSYDIYGFSPEGLQGLGLEEDEDGVYWKVLSRGSLQLKIGLASRTDTGAFSVVCWQYSSGWQAPEELPGLWAGG